METRRIGPKGLIEKLHDLRIGFKAFEESLIRTETGTFRLKGLRGYRFSRYAIAKARKYFLPSIERSFRRKGEAKTNKFLDELSGRTRSNFLKRFRRFAPTSVKTEPTTGQASFSIRAYEKANLVTRDGKIVDGVFSGSNLLKVHIWQAAAEFELGQRTEKPKRLLSDLSPSDVAVKDETGKTFILETRPEELRKVQSEHPALRIAEYPKPASVVGHMSEHQARDLIERIRRDKAGNLDTARRARGH